MVVVAAHLGVGGRRPGFACRVGCQAHGGDLRGVVRVAPEAPELSVGHIHACRDLLEELFLRNPRAVHCFEPGEHALLLGHRTAQEPQVFRLVEPSVGLELRGIHELGRRTRASRIDDLGVGHADGAAIEFLSEQ